MHTAFVDSQSPFASEYLLIVLSLRVLGRVCNMSNTFTFRCRHHLTNSFNLRFTDGETEAQ